MSASDSGRISGPPSSNATSIATISPAMRVARVLCPVDFSTAAHHGLDDAAAVARSYQAELILAHAIDFPYPYMDQVALAFDIESYYRETQQAATQRLAELAEAAGPDPQTRSEILRGNPALSIVDFAADNAIDLIVMPTHGRTGFERMLVGSVTEKVVRLAPCPVLTITPGDEPAAELSIDRILLPTDFSDRSDAVLDEALELAERFDASVLMLHVVTLGDSDPANPDWGFPAIPEEHVASVVEVAEQELRKRSARTDCKVTIAGRLVRGFDPAFEICRVAREEDIDLVVMATHGHTGLMHALLGSTAGKVIRHHDGPVLTIRVRQN